MRFHFSLLAYNPVWLKVYVHNDISRVREELQIR